MLIPKFTNAVCVIIFENSKIFLRFSEVARKLKLKYDDLNCNALKQLMKHQEPPLHALCVNPVSACGLAHPVIEKSSVFTITVLKVLD